MFAKTISEAQTMIDELTEAMASLALSWKPTSAAIIGSKGGGRKPGHTIDWERSGPEDELRVQIIEDGEATQIPIPWVDELEVLGDWVENDGGNGVAVEKRQGKGDKAYFKYRKLLVGRRATRDNNTKERLQVHVQAPQAATLHGAGTWRWESEMARGLHQWERQKLCHYLKLVKRKKEDYAEYKNAFALDCESNERLRVVAQEMLAALELGQVTTKTLAPMGPQEE